MASDASKASLTLWRTLRDTPALTDAAAVIDPTDVAAVARLRKTWPADLLHAAIDLAAARRKAADKFGHLAPQLLADPVGVEQASSLDVAAHKARRFQALGAPHVVDLCCGIGGDAMALAQIASVTAVDADPARTCMARHNAALTATHPVHAAVADVTTLPLRNTPFHIDPARRAAGKRLHTFADYQPGPAFLRDLIDRCPHGALKLGPGVDLPALPPGEVEFISRRGALVQAVLWTGDLRRAPRTATALPANTSLTGPPVDIPLGPPRRYLFTVDPAVERAQLIGVLCQSLHVHAIHPQLGLVTADELLTSPFLTPFELLDRLPWRLSKVKAWLEARGAGIVEVKTRGKAVDPDVVSRQLRGTGDHTFTLFVLRFDQRVEAWLTRRV